MNNIEELTLTIENSKTRLSRLKFLIQQLKRVPYTKNGRIATISTTVLLGFVVYVATHYAGNTEDFCG